MTPRAVVGIVVGLGLVLAPAASTQAADRDGDGLRDRFERRRAFTDPDRVDSDFDGVVDSAEDLDGDRLSNLGEQRFSTNPRSRDSDHDGRADGYEDHDHDGTNNLLQQDRRRLPRNLRPSLGHAPDDLPGRRAECHTVQRETTLHPCRWGDIDSSTSIAFFGDSHAFQWMPAADRAGRQEHWQIVQLTKAACPSISATVRVQHRLDGGRTCRAWRENAFDWLQRHEPDVIVITNRHRWMLINARGDVIPRSRRPAAWRRAMATTLARLPSVSHVVVLSDTPRLRNDPVRCLRAHPLDISACTTRTDKALASEIRGPERRAAIAAGAMTRNLNKKICPYDPCPLVQGKVMVWRDQGHLTATFTKRLWPSLRHALQPALATARTS